MTNIKLKNSYQTYEYDVTIEGIGERIIVAKVKKVDNKNLLEVALKTEDNSSLEHFVVGTYEDSVPEAYIKAVIENYIETGYLDIHLVIALETEKIIEEARTIMYTETGN